MNIFKILANGDGSINEPNVSAFLGYLLNPNEDHGLGYEFLARFLLLIDSKDAEDGGIDKKDWLRKTSSYDYEIALEAAFRDETESDNGKRHKKEIVDIVVVQFIKTSKGESYIKDLLSDTRKVERIILIENKIRKSSHNTTQIIKQFAATKGALSKDILENSENFIDSVYLTPDSLTKEIQELKSKQLFNFHHLVWKDKSSSNTIYKILKDLLQDESLGNIEAINAYTRNTLVSFVQFIETDFKSQIKLDKERGQYTQSFIDLNLSSNIEEKLQTLRNELIKLKPEWDQQLSAPNLSRPRFPYLCFELKEIDIFLHAGATSRDTIKFNYRSNARHPDSFRKLEEVAKKLNMDIKKANYKKDAYAQTEQMRLMALPIKDSEKIKEALEDFIMQAQ